MCLPTALISAVYSSSIPSLALLYIPGNSNSHSVAETPTCSMPHLPLNGCKAERLRALISITSPAANSVGDGFFSSRSIPDGVKRCLWRGPSVGTLPPAVSTACCQTAHCSFWLWFGQWSDLGFSIRQDLVTFSHQIFKDTTCCNFLDSMTFKSKPVEAVFLPSFMVLRYKRLSAVRAIQIQHRKTLSRPSTPTCAGQSPPPGTVPLPSTVAWSNSGVSSSAIVGAFVELSCASPVDSAVLLFSRSLWRFIPSWVRTVCLSSLSYFEEFQIGIGSCQIEDCSIGHTSGTEIFSKGCPRDVLDCLAAESLVLMKRRNRFYKSASGFPG